MNFDRGIFTGSILAAAKTANQRKTALTYGAYEITGGGKTLICNGNFHAVCLREFQMPKSVFQELRSTGKISERPKDQDLAQRDTSSASAQVKSMVRCAQARIKYNGWTCRRLAAPHGQGEF